MHYPICFYVIVRNKRRRFACIGDTVCNRIHATPLQSTVTLSSGTTGMLLFANLLCMSLGVGRLSAPILSILPIIDIGHFQNIFADNFFFFFFFFIMQTNILFTGDIIYW